MTGQRYKSRQRTSVMRGQVVEIGKTEWWLRGMAVAVTPASILTKHFDKTITRHYSI